METYFKNVHPDVQQKLISRAQKKIERLAKNINEGQFEAQAYVEITKVTGSQHSKAAWRTSINVDVRGDRIHAESVQDTPAKATNRAIEELQSAIRSQQQRERTTLRKRGSFWKSLLRQDTGRQDFSSG